jgi:hypothetical protein
MFTPSPPRSDEPREALGAAFDEPRAAGRVPRAPRRASIRSQGPNTPGCT